MLIGKTKRKKMALLSGKKNSKLWSSFSLWQVNKKNEVKIIILYFISGIWWIFDLICAAVAHKDYGGTCTTQIILDLPNLLAVSLPYLKRTKKSLLLISGCPHLPGHRQQEVRDGGSEEYCRPEQAWELGDVQQSQHQEHWPGLQHHVAPVQS